MLALDPLTENQFLASLLPDKLLLDSVQMHLRRAASFSDKIPIIGSIHRAFSVFFLNNECFKAAHLNAVFVEPIRRDLFSPRLQNLRPQIRDILLKSKNRVVNDAVQGGFPIVFGYAEIGISAADRIRRRSPRNDADNLGINLNQVVNLLTDRAVIRYIVPVAELLIN